MNRGEKWEAFFFFFSFRHLCICKNEIRRYTIYLLYTFTRVCVLVIFRISKLRVFLHHTCFSVLSIVNHSPFFKFFMLTCTNKPWRNNRENSNQKELLKIFKHWFSYCVNVAICWSLELKKKKKKWCVQNNIPDVSHDPCCSIFIFISKCAHWFQHRSLYACLNIAIWSFYLSQPFLFLAQDKDWWSLFCVCVCVQFGSWRDQFLLFDFCRMDTGSFERKTIFFNCTPFLHDIHREMLDVFYIPQ